MSTYLEALRAMFAPGSVLVLGFGPNHKSVVRVLGEAGVLVTVRDRKAELASEVEAAGATFECCDDILQNIPAGVTHILRTPSIPSNHPSLEAFRARGGVVTSQTQAFLEVCPATVVGITGTKGKSTTATLTYTGLKAAYKKGNVYLGGNIGQDPFKFLPHITSEDVVVLELSSYQLEDVQCGVSVAVVLQTTEDHLEHHGTLEAYHAAKAQLLRAQQTSDVAIVFADAASSLYFLKQAVGVVLPVSVIDTEMAAHYEQENETELAVITWKEWEHRIPISPRVILGDHHRENFLAALSVMVVLGVDTLEAAEAMRDFSGLPHRLQRVADADGVEAYNDSIATNQQSATSSLRAFPGRRIHAVVGGNDKGASLDSFAAALNELCVSVSFLPGPLAAIVKPLLSIPVAGTVEVGENPLEVMEAVLATIPYQNGDVIVLAPAGASVAPFANYEVRGNAFCEAVQKLAKQRRTA